jgi:hypothetical protein
MSVEPRKMGEAARAAADEQLVLYQQGFGHDTTYSARAQEFGKGGPQVDGEYEAGESSTWTVARCLHQTRLPAPLAFAKIYAFAMDTFVNLLDAFRRGLAETGYPIERRHRSSKLSERGRRDNSSAERRGCCNKSRRFIRGVSLSFPTHQ